MTLANSQYDAIQRSYDATQLKNRRILEKRRAEVYASCPAYEEAAGKVASLSIEYGRRLLEGDPDAKKDYHEALSALSAQKATLLSDAGFPADYLEPVYDCPDCLDTGYTDGRRCHCFEQKIINFLYMQSNLKELLASENFSALSYKYYQGDDLANFKKAVETSLSFIKNFHSDYQNLLFYGAVGTGKSFLSNCIAREMLNQGYSVIYFSATGLFNLLSRYSFDAANKEMLYKTYEDLYNCDLVIIDDLGTELSNSFTNSQFFSFLNERHLRKKSVLISTNLSLEELKVLYSERIFSRLTSNFTFRKLSGPDIRTCKNI
ncbi:MAG: ATP-binding protein [Lachnospiraceae bacterium]|nr:ATP-binding protein [Lachnospiraceae bacterium]